MVYVLSTKQVSITAECGYGGLKEYTEYPGGGEEGIDGEGQELKNTRKTNKSAQKIKEEV